MKGSWKQAGRWLLAAGAVFGAVAVFGGGVIYLGIGAGLLVLGFWAIRPSRRAVLAEQLGDGPMGVASLTDSFSVSLEASKYDIRWFKLAMGETPVGLSGRHLRVGPGQEWQLRVSTRRASLGCGREVLARATRESRSSAQWIIDGAGGPYWLSVRSSRSVESAKSPTHLFGKDSTGVFRRHARLARAENGPAAAEVDFEYTVAARLTRRLDADRRMVGEFDGQFEAHEPVPTAVAVLAVCLTLGRWAKRPPKSGTWTQIAPAGG